jgi:hypothetical protein
MFRYRLLKLFPFLSRWLEVSPACCGVCSTCVTTTAGNLLLPLVAGGAAVSALGGEGDGSRSGEGAADPSPSASARNAVDGVATQTSADATKR